MIRFSAPVLASVAIVFIASACGSSTPPPARVILESDFGDESTAPGADCNITDTSWVDIGSFGAPPVTPVTTVDNGTANAGNSETGQVAVTCSVRGNDTAGYDVLATATLNAGTTGGTVSISGHFTTTGTQTPINATFQRGDYGTFSESDCTVDYNENPNMGVASGRVWGQLTCNAITRPDENLTCSATAQFRFENCDQ